MGRFSQSCVALQRNSICGVVGIRHLPVIEIKR
jgi:hypothetical protein